MQANEDDILVTEGLGKSFGDFKAVSDVALRVRRGPIHALIGPNGAGKTTCFNLFTKFLRRRRADRLQWPRHHRDASPADVARMGLARSFQISAVFPHLSVRENVRVALQRKLGDISSSGARSAASTARRARVELVKAVGLTPSPRPAVDLPTAASARWRSPRRWRSIRR